MNLKMSRQVVLVTLAAFGAAACSKNSQGQQPRMKEMQPSGKTQDLCLDRLLITVPNVVQVSQTDLRIDGSYIFKGTGEASKGIVWNGIAIRETQPTDKNGYGGIYKLAKDSVADAATYKRNQVELEAEVRNWTKYSKEGDAGERETARRILQKKTELLSQLRKSAQSSGEAKVPESHSFAIRHSEGYTAGYFDAEDKRVRIFNGQLSAADADTPGPAAQQLQRLRKIYTSRAPTAIPTVAGFCTAFGFIDESVSAATETSTDIMFRSASYPNLIFRLKVQPANPENTSNIQNAPKMGEEQADLHLIGIKGRYGPSAETIVGSPGRTVGYSYGDNCSQTSCRPADQAYEIEAETYGQPGRIDRPHITLHMIAATSDDYKLKRAAIPDEPEYNKPERPALSGHIPPSFDEGKKVFSAVLQSIRLRPGAISAKSTK